MAPLPFHAPLAARRLARRLRPPEANARRAYDRWIGAVEPGLREVLRVQRAGRPTELAGGQVRPADVAVVHDVAELHATRAPWVVVVDEGDRLADGAAGAFGRAVAVAPEAAVITCDEDRIDGAGQRSDPVVRPGPSPDLLGSVDLAGGAVAMDRERALACGVELGAPGWRHALARALPGAHAAAVLVHRPAGVPLPAPVAPAPVAPVRGEPSVEVVIPFRDRPDLLERAAGSLLGLTAWERLRVTLVDNGSTEPVAAALAGDERVAVLRDDRPFNFSALCNGAAARSRADVLVFLNNDTEIVEPGWLERLVGEAQRPEVGAVAPLLVYPGGAVQHAGVAVGLFGVAGHPFAGLAPDERTPFGAATDGTRDWLAVTAACVAIERLVFSHAGGFDEAFTVAGQDVDLGVRLARRGLRSLCVTDVRVVHDEARSRGTRVGEGDVARSEQSYGAFLRRGDPYYSPALARASTNCALRMPDEAP